MSTSYRLYGGQLSYFTGKVRAYLLWKRLPFVEMVASAAVYREIIVPRVGFPVIPVIVTPDDETLQDTTEIIDALERRHPDASVYPATPLQRLVALLLEVYGDEWLVIPAMHYRWHYNREWAIRSFGELNAPDATPEVQLAIGTKRAEPFANAAILLGAEPHMHAAIEASYVSFLKDLDRHFETYDYALGDRPSIGDFGLFGPLYAHLYRDPKSGELMRQQAPSVVRWIHRMNEPPAQGDRCFLPEDEVPSTLEPILERMMREQLPVLTDSARLLRERLAAKPGERIPRAIGTHDFELEGCRGQRIVGSYSLWMLQRARDAYRALSSADRDAANRVLSKVHGEQFMCFEDPPRLAREGLSVRLA
jgi:glutathione S-transferase